MADLPRNLGTATLANTAGRFSPVLPILPGTSAPTPENNHIAVNSANAPSPSHPICKDTSATSTTKKSPSAAPFASAHSANKPTWTDICANMMATFLPSLTPTGDQEVATAPLGQCKASTMAWGGRIPCQKFDPSSEWLRPPQPPHLPLPKPDPRVGLVGAVSRKCVWKTITITK